jgi:hypothetical protein
MTFNASIVGLIAVTAVACTSGRGWPRFRSV